MSMRIDLRASNEANKEYHSYFKELGQNGEIKALSKYAFNTAIVGTEYSIENDVRLMVVGRATNGWVDFNESGDVKWNEAALFTDTGLRDDFFERAHNSLSFVKDNGKTRSAPFWKISKLVLEGLENNCVFGVDDYNVLERMVWNNLYKLAPAKEGNPNDAMCKAQFKLCCDILQHEIKTLKPTHILFITGEDWFCDFDANHSVRSKESVKASYSRINANRLPFELEYYKYKHKDADKRKTIVASGSLKLDGVISSVVVCVRPDAQRYRKGVTDEEFARRIVEAFEKNDKESYDVTSGIR